MSRFLKFAVIVALPLKAAGLVSTTVTWYPSPDSTVAGYNIYYGTTSHNYTNEISVDNVTNAMISNLNPSTTYYFAAKARDNAGDESAFSNEASFAGYGATPGGYLRVKTMPSALTNDQLTFSLGNGAPAAASINPTNGMISWNPSLADANSSHTITVIITDLTNPANSTSETVLVNVSDYFNLAGASVPVQTNQSGSLPLTIVSSDSVTNIAFNLYWPGNQLLNPTLTFNPPIAGGTLLNQGTNLVIQLWTANGNVITGTNQFAQINFQTAAGQPSAFLEMPIVNVVATKTDSSSFANIVPGAGEVVLIGTQPLLRPKCDSNQNRTLTLYANPGNSYQLLCSTDLANWQTSQIYQPSALQQSISLDSTSPVIFYRLMQE